MTQSLYRSHMECVAAFEGLCKAATHSTRCTEPYSLELLNELDNYKIWAANLGAGNSGNRFRFSLDYRLREATFYKLQVLRLVDTLHKHVENAHQILSGVRKPFEEDMSVPDSDDGLDNGEPIDEGDESPWDLSSDSECEPGSPVTEYTDAGSIGILHSTQPTELGQLLDSIKLTVKTLYRMPIRRPAPVDRLKSESAGAFTHYIQHDCMHVQEMFPDLDTTVANRLGRLITRRRQLLAYRESHQESLRRNKDEANPLTTQSIRYQQSQTAHSTIKSESKAPSQHDSTKSTLQSGATTFRFDEVMLPDISSAHSETVSISNTSFAASEATQKAIIEVPPRPTDSEGNPRAQFECKYCSVVMRIRSERVWSKHVLLDLQPYVCTFPDCTLGDHMFETRDAWYQHETEVHRTTYFCNVDGHPTFTHAFEFRSHMQETHQLGSQLKESAMDVFRRTEGSVPGICNMCFRKQPVKNMKSHLSRHLEQVALFSIPRSDYMENNDDMPAASPLNTIASEISICDSHHSMESASDQEEYHSAEEAQSDHAKERTNVLDETIHRHQESSISPDEIKDEQKVEETEIMQEMPSHERSFTIKMEQEKTAEVRSHTHFLQRNPLYQEEKPYALRYTPPEGFPRANIKLERHDIMVQDIRPDKDKLSFERDGCRINELKSIMKYGDWDNDLKVKEIYFSEVADMLLKTLGACHVQIFDHMVRKRHEIFPISTGDPYKYNQPTSIAHMDTTVPWVLDMVRSLNPEKAAEILKHQVQCVNVWKPLVGPVKDWPLAICDPQTMNFDQDLEPCDLVYPDYVVENRQVYFSDALKWFYLSNQQPDEAWVFLQSDTDPRGKPVAHTSFPIPFRDEGVAPRESIEVRALVYYGGF